MNKLFRLVFLVMALFMCMVPNAHAAKSTILLVPLTINAPDAANVAKRIQSLLEEDLKDYDFIPKRASGAPALTADVARQKASAAKADFALYGIYNQVGEGFSLDIRLVQVGTNLARPYYKEGRHLSELSHAINEIVSKLPATMQNRGGISDIDIRGLNVLDKERVLMRINSKIGDTPNVETMDEDVRLIWDMGYFSDVSAQLIDGGAGIGDILVFDVVEKPRIIDVRVVGSDVLKQDAVVGAMTSTSGTILNETLLANDLHVVTEMYRKKGYYLTEIDYTIENSATGRGAILVLNVNTGNKLFIKEVNMIGVDEKMQKKLRKFTKLRKKNLFSFFTKYGVLEEEFLQRDMDAVHGYLVDKGYLDVVVEYPTVNYEEDGIVIDFNIQPGERYRIGEIDFAGDLLEDKEKLFELISLEKVKEKEEYFSLTAMQDDMKKLKNLYNDFGFAFAEVTPDTKINKELALIDITFVLNPKEKVYIRNVFIEGNIETRDNVILRELRLADGQQYDGAKIRRSIERLYKLQFFQDVNIDLIPTENPSQVDLKISVTESHTGTISMGVGYSTYDSVGVSISLNQANLFGRGYNLGINGYVSGKTMSMKGTFINPRINDTNLGFMASAYAIDQEWLDYDKRTVGTQWGITYPLGEYTNISTSYRLEFYNLSDVATDASTAIKSYEGDNIASVVSAGITRDTTNHPLNPTRGTRQSIFLEYGGNFLGGSDNFYKATASYGFYYGFNQTHVIHARGTIGGVYKNSDDPIPAFERFYLGGMNSLRGYEYEDVSPQDVDTGESIGATHVAYGSLEYICRISEEFSIFLVPFLDFATTFDADYNTWGDKNYYSTGLELRWNSPFGALRFAYGIPLTDSVTGESLSGRFEFSMGRAF